MKVRVFAHSNVVSLDADGKREAADKYKQEIVNLKAIIQSLVADRERAQNQVIALQNQKVIIIIIIIIIISTIIIIIIIIITIMTITTTINITITITIMIISLHCVRLSPYVT